MLSNFANLVTGILRRTATFVDFMRTFLNLSIAFEKHDKKDFIANSIIDIVQNVMDFDFPVEMSLPF